MYNGIIDKLIILFNICWEKKKNGKIAIFILNMCDNN